MTTPYEDFVNIALGKALSSDVTLPNANSIPVYSGIGRQVIGKTLEELDLVVSGDLSVLEPTIVAGTSSEYYRGDKTWQTLDKTAVGLGNVDNTSDADKPVSTAQGTAIGLKADKTITVSAGTGLSGGGDLSANRTINLANTAVTPATYGSATKSVTFTVDAQGRITAASENNISAGLNVTVVASGTLTPVAGSHLILATGNFTLDCQNMAVGDSIEIRNSSTTATVTVSLTSTSPITGYRNEGNTTVTSYALLRQATSILARVGTLVHIRRPLTAQVSEFALQRVAASPDVLTFNLGALSASQAITMANKSVDLQTMSSVASSDTNNLGGTRTRIVGGSSNTVSGTDNVAVQCTSCTLTGTGNYLEASSNIVLNSSCSNLAFYAVRASNTTFGTLPPLPAKSNVVYRGWFNTLLRTVWYCSGYEVIGSKEISYADLLTVTTCNVVAKISLTAKSLGTASANLVSSVDGTSLPTTCHTNMASTRTTVSHRLTLTAMLQGATSRSITIWDVKSVYAPISDTPLSQTVTQVGASEGFTPTVTFTGGGVVAGGSSYQLLIAVAHSGAGSDNVIWTGELETTAMYTITSF